MTKIQQYETNLRELIEENGYTFKEVSEETGISLSALFIYARGERSIPHDCRKKIAHVIGCSEVDIVSKRISPPEVLAGVSHGPLSYQQGRFSHAFGSDDMNKKRRELLQLIAVASTALILPPSVVDWEHIEASLARPGLIDHKVVENLDAVNGLYWNLYCAASSKASVLDGALGHLKTLVQFLQNAYSSPVHTDLCAVASDLAQMIGEIFFDLHDYDSAQSAYTFAVTAAKEAEHYDLWACALTRNSYLPIYDEDYERALPLVQEARRMVIRGDSQLVTHYWVESVAAETFAGLHQGSECRNALNSASGVVDADIKNSPAWLRFEGSRLSALRGTCFVRLCDPQAAYPPLQEALLLVPDPVRRRAMVLTDLGLAAALQGDVDRACTYGNEAVEIAAKSSSLMLREGLLKLRGQLDSYKGSASVQKFDARLTLLS